jgi:hypothetical protein
MLSLLPHLRGWWCSGRSPIQIHSAGRLIASFSFTLTVVGNMQPEKLDSVRATSFFAVRVASTMLLLPAPCLSKPLFGVI